MSESNRKVDEQAREVVAAILLYDISDPRLGMVTVTGCKVSQDRSNCTVYYTTEPDRYPEVEAALEGAKGAIRSAMATQLSWRVAPELRFVRDDTVDAAEAVSKYIEQEKAREAVVTNSVVGGAEF